MNAIVRRIFVVGSCLGLQSLHAQEVLPTGDGGSKLASEAAGKEVAVGELSDGVPPPPPEPKSRLVFEPDDIVASRTKDLGGSQVTFQKVAPIELPSLPEQAQPAPAEAEPLPSGPDEGRERQFVFIGASVCVAADAPDRPRSYVRYWPAPGGKPVGLWINANLLWLTGFAEFETNEKAYSLLMAISRIDVREESEMAAHIGGDGAAPTVPVFPDETKASFVVVEGSSTEEELAPIQALIDLYNSDKERLRVAYEGRIAAAEAKARELRENPPGKKDLLIRYWRLDQAGQAGVSPKPAVIR